MNPLVQGIRSLARLSVRLYMSLCVALFLLVSLSLSLSAVTGAYPKDFFFICSYIPHLHSLKGGQNIYSERGCTGLPQHRIDGIMKSVSVIYGFYAVTASVALTNYAFVNYSDSNN